MKKLFLLSLLLMGCGEIKKPEPVKRYSVVSMFDEVVFTTDNELEAHKKANGYTAMGRVLASKPVYFVRENHETGGEKITRSK